MGIHVCAPEHTHTQPTLTHIHTSIYSCTDIHNTHVEQDNGAWCLTQSVCLSPCCLSATHHNHMGVWKQPPQNPLNSTESGCPPGPQPRAALLSTLPLLAHHPFILPVSTATHYSVVMIMSHWRSQGRGPQAVQRRQRSKIGAWRMWDAWLGQGMEGLGTEVQRREWIKRAKTAQVGRQSWRWQDRFSSLPPSLFSLVYTFLPLLPFSFLPLLPLSPFHRIFFSICPRLTSNLLCGRCSLKLMAIHLPQSTNCCDYGICCITWKKERPLSRKSMQEGQCIGSREGLRKLRTTTPYGQTGLHTQLSSYPTSSMASMIDLHGSLLCTGSPQFHDLPGSASNFHRYFPMGSQSHILQPLIHIPSSASPSSQRLLCFLPAFTLYWI